MFYRELRWEDAEKFWNRKEPLYEGRNAIPILLNSPEEAKICNTEGISFYAELEYLTIKNKGLTHFWRKEGYDTESGEEPYMFIVKYEGVWYTVIGKWKDEEDARKELTACGYTTIER